MKRRILAVLVAALMILMIVVPALAAAEPATADVAPAFETPEGYNDIDYQNFVAFLEQTDENGVKNGERMNENYDPNDPATFTFSGPYGSPQGVRWMQFNGLYYAVSFGTNTADGSSLGLVGELDVSGCERLGQLIIYNNNISSVKFNNCPMLSTVSMYGNPLTTIEHENCPSLSGMWIYDSEYAGELDMSAHPELMFLMCQNTAVTSVNVTGCANLNVFNTLNTCLTELDLSTNPNMSVDHIGVEGNGYVGYAKYYDDFGNPTDCAEAYPFEGETFLGWFTDEGELISEEALLQTAELGITSIVARFSEGTAVLPGDVDGNGDVSVSDAVLALRAAMGILELTPEQFAAADVDGSGDISVSDAIIILRMAMGLI